MDEMAKLLYDTRRLMMLRHPRFASEIANANISYNNNLKYHTAATDGKNIFFDSNYLASLSESDRLFLIAHELMHIKFAHAFRLEDKNGKKRDPDVWNEATDAIINANLQRDGFTIKEGYVNRPEALNYSAEEFYEILLNEKKAKEQEQQEKQNDSNQNNQENGDSKDQSNSQDNQSSNDKNNSENQHIGDDHSLWEEAFERRKNGNKFKDNSNSSNKQSDKETKTLEYDEKEEFSSNREERINKAKEKFERMKNEMLSSPSNNEESSLGSVGESAKEFDWRLLLRREIEKTETIWSQRRSIAENNYAYRLEENDIEDAAETEVMIDVSGSVDLDLVRAFLRIIKPILKESKLKVGCFNEKFWGMNEIKSVNDIDNFVIPSGARGHSSWTEDWDLAVRSFTKKREINKIVFTDGYPCPGNFPKDDLRNENVIWIVYGNKNFKPCCGKVIQITSSQLQRLNNFKLDDVSIKTR